METLWLGFVAMSGSAFVSSLRSRSWIRVRGRITAAWVSEQTSSDNTSSSFTPAVRYEYQFEGRKLWGERIGFVVMGARHRGVAAGLGLVAFAVVMLLRG